MVRMRMRFLELCNMQVTACFYGLILEVDQLLVCSGVILLCPLKDLYMDLHGFCLQIHGKWLNPCVLG